MGSLHLRRLAGVDMSRGRDRIQRGFLSWHCQKAVILPSVGSISLLDHIAEPLGSCMNALEEGVEAMGRGEGIGEGGPRKNCTVLFSPGRYRHGMHSVRTKSPTFCVFSTYSNRFFWDLTVFCPGFFLGVF